MRESRRQDLEARLLAQQFTQSDGVAVQARAHPGGGSRVAAHLQEQVHEALVCRADEERAVLQEGARRAPLGAAQELATADQEFGAPGGGEARLAYEPALGIEGGTRKLRVDAEPAQTRHQALADDRVRARQVAAETRVERRGHERVRDLLPVQDGAPSRRTADDIHARGAARFQVEQLLGALHVTERYGGRRPGVQPQRRAAVVVLRLQQLGVAAHVRRTVHAGLEEKAQLGGGLRRHDRMLARRRAASRGAPRAAAHRCAVALLAFGLVLAAGCSRERALPERPGPPQPGGTLRVAVFEPLDNPSPLIPMNPITAHFLAHVTPPLGRLDDQGTVRPLLARRWVDTGNSLDFVLRPLKWEDGAPVTARDIVLTTHLLHDRRAWTWAHARLELVRAVTARDDSTVCFSYLAPIPRRVLDALVMPLPAHAQPADSNQTWKWAVGRQPLACGPFRLERATPRELVLRRNQRSGFTLPHVESVEVRVREPEEAVRMYRADSLDVLEDLPTPLVREVRAVPGTRIEAMVGRSYLFMAWNLRDGRFAEAAVRRAAAMAVDVPGLIHELTLGQGDPARGPLVPALGFADTTALLPHDPRAARQLLDGAGWRGGEGGGGREKRGARLAFHILVRSDSPLQVAVAQGVARDLERIGLAAEVRVLALEDMMARLQGAAFEAFVGEWYPDLGLDLAPIWHSRSTDLRNYGGFSDPGVDSLLTRLHHDMDEETRAQVLGELQRRIYAGQPYVFLFQKPRFVVLSARVRGADPEVLDTFWNLPQWWIAPARQAAPGAR